MKNYELSVLFHPDLEMNLDPALDKVTKIIQTNGGQIDKTENDAYPISGQDFAIYYYFNLALPSDAPVKISSALNITDEVLRYLLVRADERRPKANTAEDTEAANQTKEQGE